MTTGFVPYFKGIRKRTERLVPLIPSATIEWRPASGAMSFGDALRLIAGTERWMWAEMFVMLRMIGVMTPPIFGLTAELVGERSKQGEGAE